MTLNMCLYFSDDCAKREEEIGMLSCPEEQIYFFSPLVI